MKPLIIYVDDEPMNLLVFEAAMPDSWDVKTFDNPVQALALIGESNPAVIISDQKMPSMNGVQFLELAKQIRPHAIRIIVTGYSDEDLVVQSVRKARIFDYLKKPWEPSELETTIQRAVDFNATNEKNRQLQVDLVQREQLLQLQNADLNRALLDLEKSRQSELDSRRELECWVPPFVRWAVQQPDLEFPLRRDITGITFDIINSSALHECSFEGRPIRSRIIQVFSESLIRHGGWRESHSGDSAYGHFGLQDGVPSADAALSVAQEFRAGLKSLATLGNVAVECGVGLHLVRDAMVDMHTVQMTTPKGLVTQKSFDTTSTDVDLLHRIEKLAHDLPGSNIVMSGQFLAELKMVPPELIPLGSYLLRGQAEAVELYLLKSNLAGEADVERLRAQATTPVRTTRAA